ncbi:MAG: extracellular solute-binding protein [Erysipelotrichaceae bacterium]|nr:extracellular solute-binding protein [Erysipelotrichaceae bacterium]
MKKLLALLLAAAMVLGLAACGNTNDAPADDNAGEEKTVVTLKVWAAQDDQDMTKGMIDEFIAANPDKEWDITLAVVGEPDAKTKYLEDPAAAADVFAFANDQLRDLVAAGALYKVTRNAEDVIARNGEGAVGAATLDGQLYAYPMTADNGYFMYYDSSVFTAEDVQTLDGMLAAAEAAGKKVFMDVSNGWYIASFFLGNGGTLAIDANGNQTCDFNNANGLATAEAIKAFTAHPAFITGDDTVLTAGIQDGTIAAGVSGTWNADAISTSLGENYAATKLPTFTVAGAQVQMSSFGGYKQIGVNSQTKFPVEAMDLADWLTNEANQVKRFETRALGPSNVNAAASEAVKSNVALAALSLQSQFAVSQNDVLGAYWTPAEAFGTTMEAKDYSTDLQTLLDTMVAQITAAQ